MKMSISAHKRVISQETRMKLSLSRRREKHHAWLGGISYEPYGLGFNKTTKAMIIERDGGKCQNPGCLEKSKRINIHHIDYDKRNHEPNNLITLCTSCHAATNFNREKWKIFYAEVMRNRVHFRENFVRLVIG